MAANLSQRGSTSVELIVALPVALLLGFVVLQLVLLYQAKLAIDQAVVEAARSGSTNHASDEALRTGLARGLAPWLFGADNVAELRLSEARALGRVEAGLSDGSIALIRRAPTMAAFNDWEVEALDPWGEPLVGLREIPNDNLEARRRRSQPGSGVAGYRGDEPIGSSSGVTLVDANLLRVELIYGMRLAVPIAGRMIATLIRGWQGCAGGADATTGSDSVNDAGAAADFCRQLGANPPRLPLRAVATMRMMSPARRPFGGALAAEY